MNSYSVSFYLDEGIAKRFPNMVKPFNLYTCCSNKKKKRSIKTNDNVAKTDVKRQTICSTISEFFSHDDLHPRNFVPCLILCLYSFAGAGIFFGIETLGSCPHDFWSSLFFVLTIYTSIGKSSIVHLIVPSINGVPPKLNFENSTKISMH